MEQRKLEELVLTGNFLFHLPSYLDNSYKLLNNSISRKEHNETFIELYNKTWVQSYDLLSSREILLTSLF